MKYILLIYLILSVVTFIAYGLDKRAAMRGRWRTPEATLQILALLGGFIGGFLGQRVFRHKTRKLGFLIVFWAIVALHAGGWLMWTFMR